MISNEKDLKKNATEFIDKIIKFEITIKNNCNSEWPGNGKTKLIYDKSSDIEYNDILLDSLKFGQNQQLSIILNIENMKVGHKECIFHFSINEKIYGKPLILNLNLEEDERITSLRTEYLLSQDEYDSKKLWEVLKKVNFDINKAFNSLFQN